MAAPADNPPLPPHRATPEHPLRRLPHPIPYQGSKRQLAPRILAIVRGRRFRRLYEPFAGSAAITLAAAHAGLADRFVLSDSLPPLAEIWRCILEAPATLADAYERLWHEQLADPLRYYDQVRARFNRDGDPARLLFLLARCVKNAPRFNQQGEFNQSPDRRRLGMHPVKMRRELLGAAQLLRGRTEVFCLDFEEALRPAGEHDLVYLDPPYEGVTRGEDRRYHQGVERERLVRVLAELNCRGVPYLLSYDGRCGSRTYGSDLPAHLQLTRLELPAGRSSQATLVGRVEMTVESLYLSPALARGKVVPADASPAPAQ